MHGLACIVVVPIDRKCDRLRRINPSAPYDKSKSLGSDGCVDGDEKCPSTFLVFKYDNKQDVIIPKICTKVAYAS